MINSSSCRSFVLRRSIKLDRKLLLGKKKNLLSWERLISLHCMTIFVKAARGSWQKLPGNDPNVYSATSSFSKWHGTGSGFGYIWIYDQYQFCLKILNSFIALLHIINKETLNRPVSHKGSLASFGKREKIPLPSSC